MARLSISNAWQETSAFLARETRLLVPLALALLFLPGVIAGLAAPNGRPTDMEASGTFLLLFFLEVLIGAIAQLAIARLALGHREQLGESIRHAAMRLPAYVGALLIVGLPLSFLLGAAIAVARGLVKGVSPGLALVVLIVIILLSAALIIAAVRCLLNTAIASVEPGGPLRLLKRGFALTRGQALRLLGAALLFLIGGGIATVALTSAVGAIVLLALGPPQPWTVAALLVAIVGAAAQAAFGVVFTVFFARVYAQRVAEPSVPSSAN